MLQEMMDNQMIPLIIFGVSFLAIVGYLGHLEMKTRLRTERAEKLSSLRSTVTLIDDNIRSAVERHPVIDGTFKIQGENTTKFLDHGSIYSFRDEFFFPINTPIVEKVDTDSNRTSHINKNTFIKVEGTVESYVISAELNDSNLNCRVTFNSSTNTFDEKIWEPNN